MRRLDVPPFASTDLYDISVSELANAELRAKFEANRPTVVEAFQLFDENSLTKTWCNLPRAAHGQSDAMIVGTLSKGELVALYDEGVVKSHGESRRIYDQIKVSARDECPYCGGVGEMGEEGELGTADHFLPKAYFPTYSVIPANLVPACQVCNKGMGASFPTDENLQPLHPYLDEDYFFNTKWLFASVRPGDPLVVDYSVNPPVEWPEKDRLRVAAHFKACKLESRYRSRVWSEISPLISQRSSSLRILSSVQFQEHLIVTANEPRLPINGWKRVLFSGLANSGWFCENAF
jgi:5-methylcytosine-specific restriction endonuclease McrA